METIDNMSYKILYDPKTCFYTVTEDNESYLGTVTHLEAAYNLIAFYVSQRKKWAV